MTYVAGTLLLAKKDNKKYISDKFSSFHKSLKFTTDYFKDNNLYFLDITINKTH